MSDLNTDQYPSLLQSAFRANEVITTDAQYQLDAFLRDQRHPQGGFCDRAGKQDLYYTMFGLSAACVLGRGGVHSATRNYLQAMTEKKDLNFIELVCLLRCRRLVALMSPDCASDEDTVPDSNTTEMPQAKDTSEPTFSNADTALLSRIEYYRQEDGGFNASTPTHGAAYGTAYGAYLALQAYTDTGRDNIPDAHKILACIDGLQTPDGGYANEPGRSRGTTTATAAAAIVFSRLGVQADNAAEWLLTRTVKSGGFTVTPDSVIPDLLSTATALFALTKIRARVPASVVERCYEFLEGVWKEQSGFCAHLTDTQPDTEYTFYGLLALGCLVEIERQHSVPNAS